MKIVADENVERPIVVALRAHGHSVMYIAEDAPSIADGAVLQRAAEEQALLITRDKDFRQLAIEARRPCWGVLYMRLADRPAREKAELVVQVIEQQGTNLNTVFATLLPDGLQTEPLPQCS